jgi:hypothetical protein
MIYILFQVNSMDIYLVQKQWFVYISTIRFQSLWLCSLLFHLHLVNVQLSLPLGSHLPYLAESKFYESTQLICKMNKLYVLKIIEAIEELYDEFTNSGRNMGASRKKTRSQAIITHFFSLTHALHTTPMALCAPVLPSGEGINILISTNVCSIV